MKKIIVLLFAMLVFTGTAFAVGTVTIAYQTSRTINKCTLDWLSDASGDATVTTVYISGIILKVVFIPDAAGTQPSDLYDVTLKDDNEVDILQGAGANLSNSTTTEVSPFIADQDASNVMPNAIDDKLDLAVSNAGNAKGGKLIIYYR